MEIKKNDIYEITIEDLTTEGQGVGHIAVTADSRMTVFVKDTAPGDVARIVITKVKKNIAYGRLMELLEESEVRVEPVCPVARQCGGCTLMHISYEEELRLKKKHVISCLERIGGITNAEQYCEGIVGSPAVRYRNKMQFPVGYDRNGNVVCGFYAGRTHSIIPIEDCVIGHDVNRYIVSAVKMYMTECKVRAYDEESHSGVVRHIVTRLGFATGELMVGVVINADKLPREERLAELLEAAVREYNEKTAAGTDDVSDTGLAAVRCDTGDTNCAALTVDGAGDVRLASVMLSVNKDKTNRILGSTSRCIYGTDAICDYIGDVKFRISLESFYQVNPAQTVRLYEKAREYAGLTGSEDLWDLYCGIGTISLYMAGSAKSVHGVEIVPQAIDNAKENARMNGFENAEFYVGKAEVTFPEMVRAGRVGVSGSDGLSDGASVDEGKSDASEGDGGSSGGLVVVVDPPRKGCDAVLLDAIVDVSPDRLVYVSCDPATLARDLKILGEKGYAVKRFTVFDQFCRSMHTECVTILVK